MSFLKISLIVLFLVTFVYSQKYGKYYQLQSKHEKKDCITYSFNQVYKLILKSLSCLEKTPDLSINGTFAVVQALAFLSEVFPTVPGLKGKKKDKILHVMDRLEAFIQKSYENYPDLPGNKIWWPYYFGTLADLTFKAGRVPKYSPFKDKTIEDILNDTYETCFTTDCTNYIFADNDVSCTPRECRARCQNEMFNLDYKSGISNEEKAWYIGNLMIMNCTNLDRQTYVDYVVHLCAYVKREVDTMLLYKNQPIFEDSLFFYARKVAYCSSYGLPEFLCPKIIMNIINKIDCRGCVGADRTLEEKQVLTAGTISVLGLLLRAVVQKEYGYGSF